MTNTKIKCFLAVLEGKTYVVPHTLSDDFESSRTYERERRFGNYILSEEGFINDILVEESDLQSLIDGDFD